MIKIYLKFKGGKKDLRFKFYYNINGVRLEKNNNQK